MYRRAVVPDVVQLCSPRPGIFIASIFPPFVLECLQHVVARHFATSAWGHKSVPDRASYRPREVQGTVSPMAYLIQIRT